MISAFEGDAPGYLNQQEPFIRILGRYGRGFAGVNTDQCVGGSLQDAFTKGWDCLLLSDGYATTSPNFAKQCIGYNCEVGWGFVLSCKDLAKGADNMQ